MKRKVTLVKAIGGVDTVVQDVVPAVRTSAICPACKKPFNEDDPTVLIELVKRIPVTEPEKRAVETAVRVHVCEPCAQPVVAQKREAMNKFLSLIAEMIADDMFKEMEAEGTKEQKAASTLRSRNKQRKPRARRRRDARG